MLLHDRLQRGMAVLETLDYCRQITGTQSLGTAVENAVLDAELSDIAICTEIDLVDERIREIAK